MRLVITDKPRLFHAFDPFAPVRYGYLYNWLAIEDERGITAPGAHVPTLAEWEALQDFIGSDQDVDPSLAGGYLKENSLIYWNTPNTGANNLYSFNARGNGLRTAVGGFTGIKNNGRYHSSDADNYGGDNRSGVGFLYFTDTLSFIYSTDISTLNRTGMGIRVVKDSTVLTHGQTGTYTGNDGKVYPTICINGVEWLARNLAESQYRTGDIIPLVQGGSDWAALNVGARCIYDNNPYNLGDNIEDPVGELPEPINNNIQLTFRSYGGTFTMYLAGTENVTVDWGDGSEPEEAILSNDVDNPTELTHEYDPPAGDDPDYPEIVINSGVNVLLISAENQSITQAAIPASCVNIQVIKLGTNPYAEFETHSEWIALEELNLYGNTFIGGGISSLETHAEWVELRILSLQENLLESIVIHPEWVNLEGLGLNDNLLTELVVPSTLNSLNYLYADSNNLTAFTTHPEWVNLSILSLSDNPFSSNIVTHVEWVNLRALQLDDTGITSITAYSTWVLMDTLYLRDNALADINAILIALDNAGISEPAIISFLGGTNAVPSGDGITAMNALISRGCSVQTNT